MENWLKRTVGHRTRSNALPTLIILKYHCGRKTLVRGEKMAVDTVKIVSEIRRTVRIAMHFKRYRKGMMTFNPLITTLKEIEGKNVPPERISAIFNRKDGIIRLQDFSQDASVGVCYPGASGQARLEWQFFIPGKLERDLFIMERINNRTYISVQNYNTGKVSYPISLANDPKRFIKSISSGVLDFLAFRKPKKKHNGNPTGQEY
jgi:hypothetical protein